MRISSGTSGSSGWRRIVIALSGTLIVIPLLVLVWQIFYEPGRDRRASAATDPAAQQQRGEYLAKAGNCAACHTARGGQAYAGGRAIATPFGDIYSSNLTPDRQTGIGNWSPDDFWRALHNGKSKDGRFLYPAFPYTNFTKVTREDSDALYTYLRSIPAVEQANLEPALRFPFNQRLLLAFWRALYFTPGEFSADPKQSAQWNRGGYLVQGLGHCSACHTSRNALGGSMSASELAGGMIPMQHWQASALISGANNGLDTWQVGEIEALLKTGVSARGAVYGPMAEVVAASLQHLSDEDIHAIASYLKALPNQDSGNKDHTPAPLPVAKPAPDKSYAPEVIATLEVGAKLYEKHCAECHQSDGTGKPPAYPPLAGKSSVYASVPTNAIRMILSGGYPPSTAGNPRPYGMPAYAVTLSDEQIAALVSYIRNSWGNRGAMITPNEVNPLRGAPL